MTQTSYSGPADGLSETHGQLSTSPPKTLWVLLQEGVRKNPDGLALACPHHTCSHLFPSTTTPTDSSSHAGFTHLPIPACLEWSFSQLSSHAEHLALRIHQRLGTLPATGAVMATFVSSGADWALLFWSAARLGVAIAALDPKILPMGKDEEGREAQAHYLSMLQPSWIVVQNAAAAEALDAVDFGEMVDRPRLKIMLDGSTDFRDGWISLEDLLMPRVSYNLDSGFDTGLPPPPSDPSTPARILFTGGSTGLPKACPHTGHNLTAESDGFYSLRRLSVASRTLVQSPVHHIMANAAALLSWRAGAGVVFPTAGSPNGGGFDAGESIAAIEAYGCTYLPVHHSMTDALLRHPEFGVARVESVRGIQIGGALIGPELAQLYARRFGVRLGHDKVDIFPFWGSTEGMYTTACGAGQALVSSSDGELLSVGRVHSSGRVKVADVETDRAVACGTIGELHFGGDTVISGYLGGTSSAAFYTDQAGWSWFRTGDQGRMAADGSVFMLGRYKDMIKRGGENIFPQQIEHRLLSRSKIMTKIIGVPDALTGEACVAIVDPAQSESFDRLKLQTEVTRLFGSELIFAHILTLEDLGLSAYPLNPGGKVLKPALRRAALNYLKALEDKPEVNNLNGTGYVKHMEHHKGETVAAPWINLIKSTWAKLLHIDASTLDDDLSVNQFTDSLTGMRWCFEIQRATGICVVPADLNLAPTIRDQAHLLNQKVKHESLPATNNQDQQQRSGPPQVQDILVCEGKSSYFDEIKQLAHDSLSLRGFDWDEDVLDVYTSPDYLGPVMPSARSQNLRFTFEVEGLSYDDISKALGRTISTQSTLACMGLRWHGLVLMVQMRHSARLLDKIIEHGPEFDSVEHAVDYHLRTPGFLMTAIETDMLARFAISPISGPEAVSSQRHVITISLNHLCGDAMVNTPLLAELDTQLHAALSGVASLPAAFLSYKTYADMYHGQQMSLPATRSAVHMASQLHGISTERAAAWPAWNGHDLLSLSPEENCTQYYIGNIPQVHWTRVSGLTSVLRNTGLTPATALKTAFSLAMMRMSGQNSAQFLSMAAGRAWPFQDQWVRDRLPNPAFIGGPTIRPRWEWIRSTSRDTEGEVHELSILALMHRIQLLDAEVQDHVQAPLKSVVELLNDDDIKHLADHTERQFRMIMYNHVPDIGLFVGQSGLSTGLKPELTVGRARYKCLRQRGFNYFCSTPAYFQCGFLQGSEEARETCVVVGLVDETQWTGNVDNNGELNFGKFARLVLDTLRRIAGESGALVMTPREFWQ